jgi:glycosyltransferase involved in cell wall biosynthesis
MRILVVIDTLGYGGAERLLVSLLPELNKEKNSFSLAVTRPPYSLMPELEAAGISVHCLNLKGSWYFIDAAVKLAKLCKDESIDIIWGHLYFGNIYSSITKIIRWNLKVVWTLHYKYYKPVDLKQAIMIILERIAFKYFVNARVAVSKAVLNSYPVTYSCNIKCIYNGISIKNLPSALTFIERADLRAQYHIKNTDFLIVLPGRFTWVKGHLVLLEALAHLKNKYDWSPICIAAGSGDLKAMIQGRVKHLNLTNTVRLLEPLPQSTLFQLILAADAIVLPSIIEPFGIAAAEAMALGVPTVLTNVDGFKELVGESKAALFVPANDADSLANTLWQLHTDENLKNALSIAGKNRIAEYFDIVKLSTEWESLFRTLDEKV